MRIDHCLSFDPPVKESCAWLADTYHIFNQMTVHRASLLQIFTHSDHGSKATSTIDCILQNSHPGIKSSTFFPVLLHLIETFQDQLVTHRYFAVTKESKDLDHKFPRLKLRRCDGETERRDTGRMFDRLLSSPSVVEQSLQALDNLVLHGQIRVSPKTQVFVSTLASVAYGPKPVDPRHHAYVP